MYITFSLGNSWIGKLLDIILESSFIIDDLLVIKIYIFLLHID